MLQIGGLLYDAIKFRHCRVQATLEEMPGQPEAAGIIGPFMVEHFVWWDAIYSFCSPTDMCDIDEDGIVIDRS